MASARPTFRWALDDGVTGAAVDLCRDPRCARVERTLEADGGLVTPSMSLAAGAWYWRLRARANGQSGAATGPIWPLTVTARTADRAASWGHVTDVNSDGYADVITADVLSRITDGRVATSPTATEGGVPTGYFGSALAPAGGVNGDGCADGLGPPAASRSRVHPSLWVATG